MKADEDAWLIGRQKKDALLNMIGVWNVDVKRQHQVFHTDFDDNVLSKNEHRHIVYVDKELQSILHPTLLLDDITYAPIGRIAIYADIIHLRAIKRLGASSCAKESTPRSRFDSDLHRSCALVKAQPRPSGSAPRRRRHA